MLYPKCLDIMNIKVIEKLNILFPAFELNNNIPNINFAVRVSGSNYIGKTTVLQCLNTALFNDIGDTLDESSISTGKNEGFIKLELTDLNNQSYLSCISLTRGKRPEFMVKTPTGVLRTKTEITKFLRYHYISPNDIIQLSATPDGRRKLMTYFLYSIEDKVREEYLNWDKEEVAAYKERRTKNEGKTTLKTILDSYELTPYDHAILENGAAIISESEGLQNALQTNKNSAAIIKQKLNDLFTHNTNILHYNEDIAKLEAKVAEYDIQINDIISSNTGVIEDVKEQVNAFIGTLKLALTDFKFEDLTRNVTSFSSYLAGIKTTDTTQLETNKVIAKNDIATLRSKITNIETTILDVSTGATVGTPGINEQLIENHQTYLNQIKNIEEKLAVLEPKIEEIQAVLTKEKSYKAAEEKYTIAYNEWKKFDDIVNNARENKKRIIREQNIQVDNFEFDPDGVTLKGFDFAENAISGADRRIAAVQFTIAMNSVVKLAILEEMESLDETEELRVSKFAADKGFIILSDNVVKQGNDLRIDLVPLS